MLGGSISVSFSLLPPPTRRRSRPPIRMRATNAAMTLISNNNNNPRYSISDEGLHSRGFAVRRSPAGLDLDRLNAVFAAVGFPRRDPDRIRAALRHSDPVVWLQHRPSGPGPVAFARATGDGVFNAIVWDVVVEPSFQGMGLGKAVMERLLRDLVERGITNIALYSEPRVLGFYRPLGFVADPDGIRAMVYSPPSSKNKKRK